MGSDLLADVFLDTQSKGELLKLNDDKIIVDEKTPSCQLQEYRSLLQEHVKGARPSIKETS